VPAGIAGSPGNGLAHSSPGFLGATRGINTHPRTVRKLPIDCSRIGRQLRYRPDDVDRYIRAKREFVHEEKENRRPVSIGPQAVGASKILSWEDLERLTIDRRGKLV